MIKSICKFSLTALAIFSSLSVTYAEESDEIAQADTIYQVETKDLSNIDDIPCPFGWSVQLNPSADHSLSYLHAESNLAISVTSIREKNIASAKAFAHVASEQMQCQAPSESNLIEDGWSFECPRDQVESIVYGSKDELVLLVISGRNANTEPLVDEFMRFLAFETQK